MSNLYLARQPIYHRDLKVFAYELLYRATEQNSAPADAGDQATYSVIVNALTEIGLDSLVGTHYAFINFTRGFIVGDNPLPFTGNNVVIEVLEDIQPDQDVINGIKRLADEGHMIALDDFVYNDKLRPLIKLADIIKIDVAALDQTTIRHQVEILRKYNVKLLAEKVETQQEFELYMGMGFDYFQGYFFSRPNIVTRQRVPMNKLNITLLIAKLSDPSVETSELENIISHDVALSYKLLRYVNSAFFALPAKMKSLQQVIIYLGLQVVKQWAIVLALTAINDKPNELLTTALIRAKMCEQLATMNDLTNKNILFMVGLFSMLDALLDMSMTDILDTLSLADEINQALLEHKGSAGKILGNVIAYEQGHWDEIANIDNPTQKSLQQSYIDAVAWAREAASGLHSN